MLFLLLLPQTCRSRRISQSASLLYHRTSSNQNPPFLAFSFKVTLTRTLPNFPRRCTSVPMWSVVQAAPSAAVSSWWNVGGSRAPLPRTRAPPVPRKNRTTRPSIISRWSSSADDAASLARHQGAAVGLSSFDFV